MDDLLKSGENETSNDVKLKEVNSSKDNFHSRSTSHSSHADGSHDQNDKPANGEENKADQRHSVKSRSRSRNGRSASRSHSRHTRSRSRSRSHRRRNDRSRSRSRSRSNRRRSRSPAHRSRRGRSSRDKSRSPLSGRKRHIGDRDRPNATRCVAVFGLSLETRESTIESIFGKFGTIDHVTLVYDNHTGRSRGFGFIYYKSIEAAVDACEAAKSKGMTIEGRQVRVDFSITERAHTPTPGIYLGRTGPWPVPRVGPSGRGSSRSRSRSRSGRSRHRSRSPSYSRSNRDRGARDRRQRSRSRSRS